MSLNQDCTVQQVVFHPRFFKMQIFHNLNFSMPFNPLYLSASYPSTSFYATIGLLICSLISDFRSQALFQTLENFQVLQTRIFFWVSTLKKSWVYSINQVLKTQIFVGVATWKNLRCHPQNHFSGCRLKC